MRLTRIVVYRSRLPQPPRHCGPRWSPPEPILGVRECQYITPHDFLPSQLRTDSGLGAIDTSAPGHGVVASAAPENSQ